MSNLIKFRREFHKYPEIGWHEYRTSARIAEILADMGYDVKLGTEVVNVASIGEPERLSQEEIETEKKRAISQNANPIWIEKLNNYPGVMAVFDTGKEGPITGLRFDIDCLPYQEPKKKGFRPFDAGYISCNQERVHACGHDGHTSIGLGLALALKEQKIDLCGKIKMFFQPAEETFYGAQSIVDKGHLDDCSHFIAVHLALSHEDTPLASNTIACGCKDFLSVRQLDVTFHGKGAHPCGASQEGKNALLAAASASLNLHAIAQHENGLMRVNVGELHAGACTNVIPPEALMKIEYRGETPEISEYAGKRVFDILDGSAKAYDMNYSYVDYGEVSAGESDNDMMDIIKRAAEKVDWFEKVYYEGNVGGSDDAAVMMSHVQKNGGIGSYVGIGTNTTNTLHNPEFDFDEDCLEPTVEMLINALSEIHSK